MAYYRGLNSNIRCIEIIYQSTQKQVAAALNSNIRCIEILIENKVNKQFRLNSNIRCIEILY